MASFYANLKNTASRLLTTYGQTISFSRAVTDSFNPATGVTTPGTPVTFTGKGAAFDYTDAELVDTLIERGDIRLILEAGTAPEINDIATVDSVDYRVMNVITTSPAGTVVKYDLQLRK